MRTVTTPPGAVPSVSGTSVIHFMEAVASLHGQEVVDAALAALTPAVRAEIEELAPLVWVPATTMSELLEALARAARVSPEALIDKAVRIATKTSFGTVWRILIRLTSAEALVMRTPVIYAKTRNVGELSVESRGDGAARLVLRGYPEISDRQLLALGVSIETILEMTGRRSVHCRWSKSEGGGTFDLTWSGRRDESAPAPV